MANTTHKLDYTGVKTQELLNKIDNLSKNDIGLDKVDNTPDSEKPVSTLQKRALNNILEEAKKYTDNEIAEFDFIKIVTKLPIEGLPNRIYLVPKTETEEQNLFDEYLWVNNTWEWIATKSIDVDLTDTVYTMEETDELLGLLMNYGRTDITPTDQSVFEFYVNDDGTASVSGTIEGASGEAIPEDIVIPYQYIDDEGNKHIVAGIDGYSFINSNYVKSITLPKSIRYIGESAFEECKKLERINFNEGLKTIGRDAFISCIKIEEIVLNKGLKEVEYASFAGCENLKKIVFNEDLEIIGDNAFDGCDLRGNIIIPESVTMIGEVAFGQNHYLEGVQLPKKLQQLGMLCFVDCYSLIEIEIPYTIEYMADDTFDNCGYLYESFTIICRAGSYAEEFAKENEVNIVYSETDISNPYIVTEIEGETIMLNHNQDVRVEASKLDIHIPRNIPDYYFSLLTLAPSEDPITLTFSGEPVVWRGDDVDSDGVFVPETNTMYRIAFEVIYRNYYDNTYTIIARVGAV